MHPSNLFKYSTKLSFLSEHANTTHDFIWFKLSLYNELINSIKIFFFSEVKHSIFPNAKKTGYLHKNALYIKAVISSQDVSSLHNNIVWAIGE